MGSFRAPRSAMAVQGAFGARQIYTPLGGPQVLQNAGRLAWGSGPRGEALEYTGWDVVIVRDGKILYVFIDETSEEFRRTLERPAA